MPDCQALKVGLLIEYKMRKNFLEKLYTKCVGETCLRLFSEILQRMLLLCVQFEG